MYRRILGISWVGHISNEEVLHRINKQQEIVNTIKIRKLEYLEHIMRDNEHYGLVQLMLQGKVMGKRGPG